MKSIVVTLFAVAALGFSATAQEKREFKHHEEQPGMRGKHHKMFMAKELNLSESQKQQAKANHDEFKQKMQELDKNENITVKESRDRKDALMKEQRSKMEALLTPEQKTKMEQLKAEQKTKSNERFGNHLDKMKGELNLTESQVAQLKTQRENMSAKFKAIKENESLSRQQKRDQLMALKEEAKKQHEKIFTADQMKKMEEMKKRHHEKQPAK
jgi:Spy/CpxP family protein refolding chaperone